MQLIAATQNVDKLREIAQITSEFGMELIPMKELLGDLDIEENGSTCAENSLTKSETVCRLTGRPAIADDSGIMVDALGGAPGVMSARYAGVHGDEEANRRKILRELEGLPMEERTAHFVCVISYVHPDGTKIVAEGICPGRISFEELGDGGFGYDYIFIPEGYGETFAQLPREIKNTIGHRALALKKLREEFEAIYGKQEGDQDD
ncbi:MAG: RdgB/HAM1 family non-canonical purine NTP pyrophosphatase [Firmicutes bacterium]|nr:RdgB/HAM1 family non-canonical purine NTP pyrophosphatase [Bacillota bacterium]